MCIQYKYEELFPTYEKKKKNSEYVKRRTYDMKIAINKSGESRQALRFGLCNYGKEVFAKYGYVRVSDYPAGKNRRIYFELKNEKDNHFFHKIIKKTREDGFVNSCYFTFTPPEEYEKGYRMNWVGGEYMLKYDDELKAYYIERGSVAYAEI